MSAFVYLQRNAVFSFLHSLHFVKFFNVQIFTDKNKNEQQCIKSKCAFKYRLFVESLLKEKENPCILIRREGKPSLTARPRRSRGSAFLKDADFSATTKQQEVLFIYVCLLFFLLLFIFLLYKRVPDSFESGSMSFRSTNAHEGISSASQPV